MTRLYLAGVLSNPVHEKHFIELGGKYAIMTYYKIWAKETLHDKIKHLHDLGIDIILDSGAHTLQKGKQTPNYEAFFEGYLEYLKKYHDLYTAFVELDIENMVGLRKVNAWSERLTKEIGREPIRVWHKHRGGIRSWEEMTKQYPYIGFSGFLINTTGNMELPPERIPDFLAIARQNGCKVHGFGFTGRSLGKMNFYSVDSSSWTAGSRYGAFFYFTQGRLITLSRTNFVAKYGKVFNKLNYKEIQWWNSLQWIKMQKFLDGQGVT
jgi:hypothetical protein